VPVRIAKVLPGGRRRAKRDRVPTARYDTTATLLDGRTKQASELVCGEIVVVEAGGLIPCDGTVIDGIAMVDESAITGESAPVLREPVGDRSAVVAAARVVSGRIVVKVR
jgi:K+-transporting ATPase ATPase B chain